MKKLAVLAGVAVVGAAVLGRGETAGFVRQLVLNPPLYWGEGDDPDREVEKVSRLMVWKLFKPRWMRNLFVKELPCGCSSRFGRVMRFRWGCEVHVKGLKVGRQASG